MGVKSISGRGPSEWRSNYSSPINSKGLKLHLTEKIFKVSRVMVFFRARSNLVLILSNDTSFKTKNTYIALSVRPVLNI